jgi:hypothetical protein
VRLVRVGFLLAGMLVCGVVSTGLNTPGQAAGGGAADLVFTAIAGAAVLALLGWTVTVAEEQPDALARARERADGVAKVVPAHELAGEFDVVVGDEAAARWLRPGGRLIRP